MYQDAMAYASTQNVSEKPVPELQRIHSRISDAVGVQGKLIYEIQEKLHNIINMREPEKTQAGGGEKSMAGSFTEQMNDNILQLEVANDRLRKILNHIDRII